MNDTIATFNQHYRVSVHFSVINHSGYKSDKIFEPEEVRS